MLTKRSFALDTGLHLAIHLSNGCTISVKGKVSKSIYLQDRWHLVEIRFETSDRDAGLPAEESSKPVTQPEGISARGEERRKLPPAKPESPRNARERALRLLTSVTRHGVTSKETVAKIARLSVSSDHVVRRATIPAFLQVRGQTAQTALINLLSDPNAKIQAEAAEVLGQLDATSAIEPLHELLNHHDAEVALRAAEALGRLDDRSGLSVALRHLREDHPHTPLAAAALGAIVKQRFRPNRSGIAHARAYVKTARLHRLGKRGGP